MRVRASAYSRGAALKKVAAFFGESQQPPRKTFQAIDHWQSLKLLTQLRRHVIDLSRWKRNSCASPISHGEAMNLNRHIYIGTDSGATTSKIGAVWKDGKPVSTKLLQRPTNFRKGPAAVVHSWISAIDEYLQGNALTWSNIQGVGLAIPGPFRSHGVLDRSANLPATFRGWDALTAFSRALAEKAGLAIPLVIGNDGNYGGVAEAQQVRSSGSGTVLMLAPGSGLGTAFIGQDGLPLDGDTLAGMEAGHMPAPLHLLKVKPFPCGCGRNWGCVEAYTTLSGLPYLLNEKLAKYPRHPLAKSSEPAKKKVLSLRDLAQKGDRLAQEIFDFQARAMGLHIANLAMAFDPQCVVIGGGLMDPGSTTEEFRERYLRIIRETAAPYLWPAQRSRMRIVAATLGDLSQAIGAALVALYQFRDRPGRKSTGVAASRTASRFLRAV
jgi:glucokinase